MTTAHTASPPPARARRTGRGTAFRLVGSFLAVLALFGAALLVTLSTLGRIARSEDDVASLDHAKHAGHLAANQVREQHIQQVEMLVTGTRSGFPAARLATYDQAVATTQEATQHLIHMTHAPEERSLAEQIASVATTADRDFRATVLPALERGDHDEARARHERIASEVRGVVTLNEQLNGILEHRSSEARERTEALRNQVRIITVVCFGLAIAIAAMLGGWLVRSIMKPVAALRAGAQRVGAGDLTARIQVRGGDEFAELASTFNQMTEDLERHQRELVRNQRLASIGHVAAGVAHEINNPIGVILGYVKLLRRDPALAGSEDLGIIEDEAYQCHRIVQGLLDLARPPRLEMQEIDAAALACEAIGRLREAGKLDGVTVAEPATPAPVRADEARLRQVLLNVLVNAAEAAGAGDKIVVSAALDGSTVLLAVQDSGPGIPADVLPRIFDPFFTTKKNGTGLGLAVAQTIIEAHGGAIEVDSGPGGGTRVLLRLPAVRAEGST